MCRIIKSTSSTDGLPNKMSEGNWTVFAFEDDSINKFREERNISDSAVLKNLVEYHLYSRGKLVKKDLPCYLPYNLLNMTNGKNSRTKCLEDEPFGQRGDENEYPVLFVEFDIQAQNGVIHVINGILLYRGFEEDLKESNSLTTTPRTIPTSIADSGD